MGAPKDVWGTAYTELRARCWRPSLGGYAPDPASNVTALSRWIEDECLSGRAERVVVLAVDSLGYQLTEAALHSRGTDPPAWTLGCATSVVPSTSTAAWTSIIYGVPPAVHGIYGPVLYCAELGAVIGLLNSVRYSSHDHKEPLSLPELDRVDLAFGGMSLFERLALSGWRSRYIADSAHILSYVWSRELVRGADLTVVPLTAHDYLDVESLVLRAVGGFSRSLDKEPADRPTLHWLYLNLDPLAHVGGLDPETLGRILGGVARGVLGALGPRAEGTSIYAISDHGHVRQAPGRRRAIYDALLQAPGLHRLPQGGAGRTRWIYPPVGGVATASDLMAEAVGGDGVVFERDDPRLSELLLAPSSGAMNRSERLGDIVTIATGVGFPSASPDLATEHGGISAEEMFVPVIRFTCP